MLTTDRILSGCFAALLPAQMDVRIAPGSCIAVYDGRRAYPVHAGVFRTPADARCYALRTQPVAHRFGLARLGTYTLPDYPGEVFQLGLSGEMRVAAAHITGLRALLEAQTDASIPLRSLLASPEADMRLRRAFADAITEASGSADWDYPKLSADRARLSQCCLQAIYPVLFDHGLLLYPRFFAVRELSPPLLPAGRTCRI